MTTAQCITAILMPFIGAIQHFAVQYGYKGKSKLESIQAAERVFIMILLLMVLWYAAHTS